MNVLAAIGAIYSGACLGRLFVAVFKDIGPGLFQQPWRSGYRA